MSKSFFEFKQFKVYHDMCAMKVGTDGVLLGAWTAINNSDKKVLDIGTGSGLIALMLAQRSDDALHIDAIDIDDRAVDQSLSNFDKSPYSNIYVYKKSLDGWALETDQKYDLIVSNPPFFVSSLTSPDKQRTLARHTQTLAVEDLLKYAACLLLDKGRLSIIYPYDHRDAILKLAAENELYVKRITNVYPTPASDKPKRILFELTKLPFDTHEDNLILELSRHVYSSDFKLLIKDFYLNL